MQFKIDVDINDWNCNDEELKDFIETRIINTVSDKVTKRIFNDVYINACQKISDKVDSFIDEALSAFIDRQIIITDKWGNKVEEYENVREMLEERFDDFMTGSVDSNGKRVKKGCSYGSADTKIKYMIDQTAQSQINKFAKGIASTVDNRIKALLKDSLNKSLSDTVFKNIDVQKLLRGY